MASSLSSHTHRPPTLEQMSSGQQVGTPIAPIPPLHMPHMHAPSWGSLANEFKALIKKSPLLTTTVVLFGAAVASYSYIVAKQNERKRRHRKRILRMVKSDFKQYRLDIEQYCSQQSWNRFSVSQLNNIYSSFLKLLDDPRRGVLPLSKVVILLKNQGLSNEKVAHACAKFFDIDGNWQVDFIELVERLNLLVHGSKAKKLEALFAVYDLDGSGRISRSEFEEVVRALSHRDHEQTEAVVKKLFAAVDTNHDGNITLDEFLSLADGAHVGLNNVWEGGVQKSFGLLL